MKLRSWEERWWCLKNEKDKSRKNRCLYIRVLRLLEFSCTAFMTKLATWQKDGWRCVSASASRSILHRFNQRGLWRSYGPIITATIFWNLQAFQAPRIGSAALLMHLAFVAVMRCWFTALCRCDWIPSRCPAFQFQCMTHTCSLRPAPLRLGSWLMIYIDRGDDRSIDEAMVRDLITYHIRYVRGWGFPG